MRQEVQRALDKLGRMPPVRELSARLATRACLVAGGYAISLLPESTARLGVDGLRFVPLKGDPIKVPLAIVTRRGHMPPTLPPFLEFVRESVRKRCANRRKD